MHQLAKKGLLVAIATTGALASAAVGVANASADTEAVATGSPGVLSGNNIQVPINVPINLCGNTIDIVGALNPAFGNYCQNGDNEVTEVEQHHTEKPRPHEPEKPRPHEPKDEDCPEEEKPPVKEDCPEEETPKPPVVLPPPPVTEQPPTPSRNEHPQPPQREREQAAPARAQLAATGGEDITAVASIGAALLLGGALMYRRSRVEG